jgi:hypothetical protein
MSEPTGNSLGQEFSNVVNPIVDAAENTMKPVTPIVEKELNTLKADVSKVPSNIRKYVGIGLLVLASLFLLSRCSTKPTVQTTATVSTSIPVKDGLTKIPKVAAPLGDTINTYISTSKGVSQIISKKSINYRFNPLLGVYIDAGLKGVGEGIKYSPLGIWRVNLDVLAGYPRIGAGLSYQVLSNTYVGIAYNYNYTGFITEPTLGVSLNF